MAALRRGLCLLVLVSGEVPREADDVTDLRRWMLESGGWIDERLSLHEKPGMGRGLFTLGPIEAGETLLWLPFATLMEGSTMARNAELSFPGDRLVNMLRRTPGFVCGERPAACAHAVYHFVALAFGLARERRKVRAGAASAWGPWIAAYPDSCSRNVGSLNGTDAEAMHLWSPFLSYLDNLRTKRAALRALMEPQGFSDEEIRWCFCQVQGRSFSITEGDGIRLLPLADFMNHDVMSNTVLTRDPPEALRGRPRGVGVQVTRRLSPGEELTYDYGTRSPFYSLANYGFVDWRRIITLRLPSWELRRLFPDFALEDSDVVIGDVYESKATDDQWLEVTVQGRRSDGHYDCATVATGQPWVGMLGYLRRPARPLRDADVIVGRIYHDRAVSGEYVPVRITARDRMRPDIFHAVTVGDRRLEWVASLGTLRRSHPEELARSCHEAHKSPYDRMELKLQTGGDLDAQLRWHLRCLRARISGQGLYGPDDQQEPGDWKAADAMLLRPLRQQVVQQGVQWARLLARLPRAVLDRGGLLVEGARDTVDTLQRLASHVSRILDALPKPQPQG